MSLDWTGPTVVRHSGWLIVLALLLGCAGTGPIEKAGREVMPVGGAVETVTVFFNREGLGEADDACGMVAPVVRAVRATGEPARTALEQLLMGPTETERAAGYYSWFSVETASMLHSVRVTDDTLYVDLDDLRSVIPGASSSCGRESFFAQIEQTLAQLRPAHRILLAIEGDPRVFYDWMEIACDEANDFCDRRGFSS